MVERTLKYLTIIGLAFTLSACGGRRAGQGTKTETNEPTQTLNNTCSADTDCGSGSCTDGACVSSSCGSDNDCGTNEYCQFPSAAPWSAGTTGQCAAPCASDEQCGVIGQQCISGRCYTNLECDPANNSTDCPPGEVCNQQARSCTAPPANCYFNEQCPAGWVCNTDNSCIDPNNVNLGGCSIDSDCNSVSGCQAGSCTCNAGACQPATTSCASASDCDSGSYCANGTCQPATACSSQDNCTPYSLVCDGGYCVNPAPCDSSNNCAAGYACNTSQNPPACFPDGTAECTQDSQCAAGSYCELFTNSCQSGCRDDNDCAGQCNGAATCRCDSAHSCSDQSIGNSGDVCASNADCPGGTICTQNNCMECMSGGDCSMSCQQTCDLLLEMVAPSCPSGTSCDAISSMMCTGDFVGVCSSGSGMP